MGRLHYETSDGNAVDAKIKENLSKLHEAFNRAGRPKNGIIMDNDGNARIRTDFEVWRSDQALNRFEEGKRRRTLENLLSSLKNQRQRLAEHSAPTRDPRKLRERLENKLNR